MAWSSSRLCTRAGYDIPARVISGDTQPEVAQRVRDAGLVMLSKPVRPAKLRGLLRHLSQPGTVAHRPR